MPAIIPVTGILPLTATAVTAPITGWAMATALMVDIMGTAGQSAAITEGIDVVGEGAVGVEAVGAEAGEVAGEAAGAEVAGEAVAVGAVTVIDPGHSENLAY